MHTLMIADDEALSRFNIRTLVSRSFEGISVVAEAENGYEAVEFYEHHRPDVVIMDIRMPGQSGLEASRQILAAFPNANILICSAYDSFSLVSQALDIGVKGYLLKPLRKDELVEKLSLMLRAEPSPVEALGEQRILSLMISGAMDKDLRAKLNRYYGSIEHGLMLAFELPSKSTAKSAQMHLLKKHAPPLGYALVGEFKNLGAAFFSPISDFDAASHMLKQILSPCHCAAAPVLEGNWVHVWANLPSMLPREERTLTLDEALTKFTTDDELGTLTLESLALSMGISPQHLSFVFKEQKGINFLEYVTGKRMDMAERLLLTGELNTISIAQKCGYNDIAYFKKLFRRAHGQTPSAYREQKGART